MVQGRHVDKAPDRLCRAAEGRSRALEGMSGGSVQLTERRNFLTTQSGPAQWAAWVPQWRLRVPWKWHLGRTQLRQPLRWLGS